jgi:acyl-coenzyme A thioesterase PaaI-like protein
VTQQHVLEGESRRLELSEQVHPGCWVCSSTNLSGLRLRFQASADGGVLAEFVCYGRHEGYRGIAHGGVIASILDGAMTNCLFASGITALTADLHVRYRYPLRCSTPAVVRARIEQDASPLFVVAAEIVQDKQVKAKAVGKFLQCADLVQGM